jgi:hypothetical protein
MPERPLFFLSSTRQGQLYDMRARLEAWFCERDIAVWMFEQHTATEWNTQTPAQRLAACLTPIKSADYYIGLFESGYGTSGGMHRQGVGFTDLELFHAMREQKPILLYVLEAEKRAVRLDGLLQLVCHTMPHSVRAAGDAQAVEEAVKRDVESLASSGRLADRSIHKRVAGFLDRSVGLRWSDVLSDIAPNALPASIVDATDIDARTEALLKSRLSRIAELDQSQQEVVLSGLLDEMSRIPWSPKCARLLDVWSKTLTAWLQAVIWHDSHNSEHLGCLGSSNARLRIRVAQVMDRELAVLHTLEFLNSADNVGTPEWTSLYRMSSGMGSVCYSLGKSLNGVVYRQHILQMALRWTDVAALVVPSTSENALWRAGNAAIRGHVCLLLPGKLEDAVAEFKHSLALRVQTNADPGEIGEAEVDLGHLLWRLGRKTEGLCILESGVEQLTVSLRQGFTSRGKLKLADVYLRSGRIVKAVRQVAEADAICRFHGISVRQAATPRARAILHLLRISAAALNVSAEVTPAGYRFARA